MKFSRLLYTFGMAPLGMATVVNQTKPLGSFRPLLEYADQVLMFHSFADLYSRSLKEPWQSCPNRQNAQTWERKLQDLADLCQEAGKTCQQKLIKELHQHNYYERCKFESYVKRIPLYNPHGKDLLTLVNTADPKQLPLASQIAQGTLIAEPMSHYGGNEMKIVIRHKQETHNVEISFVKAILPSFPEKILREISIFISGAEYLDPLHVQELEILSSHEVPTRICGKDCFINNTWSSNMSQLKFFKENQLEQRVLENNLALKDSLERFIALTPLRVG